MSARAVSKAGSGRFKIHRLVSFCSGGGCVFSITGGKRVPKILRTTAPPALSIASSAGVGSQTEAMHGEPSGKTSSRIASAMYSSCDSAMSRVAFDILSGSISGLSFVDCCDLRRHLPRVEGVRRRRACRAGVVFDPDAVRLSQVL